MAGIRTVMVTTPAMLGDLIKQLAHGRVELDVIAELSDRTALATQLHALRPALVIIGLQPNEADAPIRGLLLALPASKFIALSHDGRSMVGYELGFDCIDLSDLSPDALISFIRGEAAPPAADRC